MARPRVSLVMESRISASIEVFPKKERDPVAALVIALTPNPPGATVVTRFMPGLLGSTPVIATRILKTTGPGALTIG